MNEPLRFAQLVARCQQIHVALQQQAVRTVDVALVVRNWLFGYYIVEFEQHGADRATYGQRMLVALAEQLKAHAIKGVSATNLKLTRQFYLTFRTISQTPSDQFPSPEIIPSVQMTALHEALAQRFTLGWSHYVELLTLADDGERRFYEIEATTNQWGVRELQRQIASSLYQRLALSRDPAGIRRLASAGQLVEKAADLIKDPVVLEFLGLADRPHYSEDDLESAIISQLESFLLELGKGFLFEARQKRFTFDNDHFRVDLVFYNRLLRCYVLVDLKRDKLSHQDLGQMQMYVNYFDRHVKLPEELPTIGILLCHRKNDALVELTLPADANIFASKYQLYLPSKAELIAQLARITSQIEGQS